MATIKIEDARVYWNEITRVLRVESGIGPLARDSKNFPCSLECSEGGWTNTEMVLSLITEVVWLIEKGKLDFVQAFGEIRKIEEVEKAIDHNPYC